MLRSLVGSEMCIRDSDSTMPQACGIVLSPEIIQVVPTKMRIFQGWRYLEAKDAPPDIGADDADDMPAELAAELRDLGIF